MIINEKQDTKVYHGTPGTIIADPQSILNLFEQDAIPHLQVSTGSLGIDISTFFQSNSTNTTASSALVDHKGYFSTFSAELDIIASIESLVQRGNIFIHLLYSHRSVSQAIPDISTTDSVEKNGDGLDLTNKKSEVNTKILDILRPEMRKIRELYDFVTQASTALHDCLQHIQQKDAHKEVTPSELNFSLLRLLDVLIILDHLRDKKFPCLSTDYARYRRAAGSQPALDISEDISSLGVFLSHSDPTNSKGFIFRHLRSELKRISGHEKIILDTAELAVDTLDDADSEQEQRFHQYFTPEEKFRLLRSIPHLLLIADGNAEDPKSFSVFKTSRIQLAPLQKLLRANPVLPVYGDVSVSVEQLLQRSGHYQRDAARGLWSNEEDPNIVALHNICSHWEEARDCYTQCSTQLAAVVAGLSTDGAGSFAFERTLSESNIRRSKEVFQLVAAGCQHLSRWTATVQQVLAWKYLHPCSSDHLVDLKLTDEQIHVEEIEYGRALRYNLTSREMSVLVDYIFMVKSLSASLQSAEALFAPYIRFHVHHRIQELVQRDLTPLLHRLDKRNKPILPSLLKLRSLAADWLNGQEPRKDYREYSRKHQSQAMSHPARVVGATDTQLFILRTHVRALCDNSSEVRKKSSVFVKADLEPSDVQVFEQFYRDSFFFRYLLGLSSTLRCVSNLGDLWFREGFLQDTGCIQFPIELSLPWVLTEHLISSPNRVINPPMMQNVLYILDIYNDAAHSALYVKNVQFFYDEIEAELNLAIDQLYFLLSEEVYSYFKNLSASTLMEQSYKNKMEEVALTSTQHLWVESSRIEHLLGQRNVQLLGRSVNLTYILTQHLNNKLRRDVEFAISRFESSDARGVVDLTVLLNILSDTHHRLSQYTHLDPFPHILHEINNQPGSSSSSNSNVSVSGRIARHMYGSLQRDIAPNFSYNTYTQRFMPSPIAIRPVDTDDRKPPKQAAILQAYGVHCGKAFEFSAKLTRGFFGLVHWDAYFSLDPSASLVARLISDLLQEMFEKIRLLAEYIDALKSNIPTCKAPLNLFQSQPEEAYGYFESKLRSLLAFDDLKPEVFQLFREVGNILSMLKDLSDRFELTDQFDSLHLRHLLPMYVGGGKQNEGHNTNEMSPVEAVITALSNAALQSSDKQLQSWVRCSDSLRKLPGIVSSVVEGASTTTTATASTANEGGGLLSSGSLFQWVLMQLEEFLYQQQLTKDWSPSPSTCPSLSHTYMVQDKDGLGFHYLWSVLSFLFCITESVGSSNSHSSDNLTQREQSEAEASDQRGTITNEAEFGHGFCFAGCVILHILGQRAAFELRDLSRLVLQIHSHHELGKALAHQRRPFLQSSGGIQDPLPLEDAILTRDTTRFLEQARSNQRMQGEMLARLEASYCPRSSYRIAPVIKYHPPRPKK